MGKKIKTWSVANLVVMTLTATSVPLTRGKQAPALSKYRPTEHPVRGQQQNILVLLNSTFRSRKKTISLEKSYAFEK